MRFVRLNLIVRRLVVVSVLVGCGDDDGAEEDHVEIPARAGCEVAETSGSDADLYAAAAMVLTGSAPCGGGGCHGNSPGADLRMRDVTNLHETLVGQAACQAPDMVLVDDSGGDEGLSKSYLWQKMSAAATPDLALIPQGSWGTAASCDQSPAHGFGQRMPGGQGPNISASIIEPIRNWICAGAPGP